MTNTVQKTACAALVVLMLAGCQTDSRDLVLSTSESQVALRSIQSRVFDTTDKSKTQRTIITNNGLCQIQALKNSHRKT